MVIKIVKEGEVLFRGGKVVEINNFEVLCKGKRENYHTSPAGEGLLWEYVQKHYKFTGGVEF
jgi:hypothetical protein